MDEKDLKENLNQELDIPEKKDIVEELLSIIKSNDPPSIINEKLQDYHENDIAEVLPQLNELERKKLYKIIGNEKVSEIFSYLDNVEDYIAELDNAKAADIIESMDADDAIDVLHELPEDQKQEIISLMEEEAKQDVKLIESYDDDMIGSKMTTNYITIKNNFSIKQAMRSVIDQAAENDNLSTIYSLNEDNTFYGAIQLRDLIIAREGTPLDTITTTNFPYVYARESIEDCIDQIRDYSEDSIPVLNSDNKIIGVITSSNIVDVVDEELGDDYAKFAGLTAEEDLDEPLFRSMKKRIPWLLVLLGLGLVVASIIQVFQKNIPASLIVLYTFQSLILDMSGNTGTQSLGVTIRVISDGELTAKQKWLFLLKEIKVGFCNGLLIGGIAFVFIGIYLQFIVPNTIASLDISGFAISGCIGLSLLITMIIASLIGTLIPMFFKKIGIDPAVASGPLITTLNDFNSVCTYYGLSILFFVLLMGL